MKFPYALLLLAVLAAFLAMMTSAEKRSEQMRSGSVYGHGCPDAEECTKSCRSLGLNVGICLQPLLEVCLCLDDGWE
nr:defensin BmKDfsin1-like [Dermacentor andersoni]